MSWQRESIQRICSSTLNDGGWPYQSGLGAAAEPTALACLALLAHGVESNMAQKGLRWLADRQQSSGGVAVGATLTQPCWATAEACLGWTKFEATGQTEFASQKEAAVKWLLRAEGRAFKSNPAIYGHNTRLKGWSWVEDTHSWIEPTVYALLALRAAGLEDHPRSREGVSLLLDRTMSQGGWNYGNSKMFGSELRPFPAQTGMVLAALAGEPRQECVDKALQFLQSELPRVRTPISLGWGLIGAAAWNARPDSAGAWLAQCADRMTNKPAQPLSDAMLLLADAQPSTFLPMAREVVHGT